MSKSKSIADLVIDLQSENKSLQRLKKHANRFCKDEFGYTIEELHKLVAKQELYEKRCAEKQNKQSHSPQETNGQIQDHTPYPNSSSNEFSNNDNRSYQ